MNSEQLTGLVGGLVGSLIGVIGGLIGTYCSIKNTNGPRERAFVIRAALICWALVLFFVAGGIFLPGWTKLLIIPPYVLLMSLGIPAWNRRQAQIRLQEAAEARSSEPSRS
jgi:hypothetical protein